MYLSRLELTPHTRQAKRDLALPYELHRTLTRAAATSPDQRPDRILFRVEPPPHGDARARILVQTADPPDWSKLPCGYEVTGPAKTVDLKISQGAKLQFRLRANPVKRDPESHRRMALREEEYPDWLSRKMRAAGARLVAFRTRHQQRQHVHKPGWPTIIHDTVLFEGVLEVTDPERLAEAVATGIGPAKAFGCGLLSLART